MEAWLQGLLSPGHQHSSIHNSAHISLSAAHNRHQMVHVVHTISFIKWSFTSNPIPNVDICCINDEPPPGWSDDTISPCGWFWWNETLERCDYLGVVRSRPNIDSAQSPTTNPLLGMLWGCAIKYALLSPGICNVMAHVTQPGVLRRDVFFGEVTFMRMFGSEDDGIHP